jgi:hypothetical protein
MHLTCHLRFHFIHFNHASPPPHYSESYGSSVHRYEPFRLLNPSVVLTPSFIPSFLHLIHQSIYHARPLLSWHVIMSCVMSHRSLYLTGDGHSIVNQFNELDITMSFIHQLVTHIALITTVRHMRRSIRYLCHKFTVS